MNAKTRHTAPRTRFAALALAAGLAVSGTTAVAGTPADNDLDNCVARAEQYFGTPGAGVELRAADTFRTGAGRQVLALDLALDSGVKPRFYCVLDADGRIAQVNTLPRLPARPAAMLVAK